MGVHAEDMENIHNNARYATSVCAGIVVCQAAWHRVCLSKNHGNSRRALVDDA